MTSTSIVLPALDQWAEGKITALYQATTQDDFNTAFDDFIAKDVHIYVNGAKMTRDQYKQLLEQQRILESSATVKFDGVVRTQLPGTEFTQVRCAPVADTKKSMNLVFRTPDWSACSSLRQFSKGSGFVMHRSRILSPPLLIYRMLRLSHPETALTPRFCPFASVSTKTGPFQFQLSDPLTAAAS